MKVRFGPNGLMTHAELRSVRDGPNGLELRSGVGAEPRLVVWDEMSFDLDDDGKRDKHTGELSRDALLGCDFEIRRLGINYFPDADVIEAAPFLRDLGIELNYSVLVTAPWYWVPTPEEAKEHDIRLIWASEEERLALRNAGYNLASSPPS